ncbi:MAG: hypothetical protein ACP5MH_09565 [Thermoproteus sp.]
MRNAAGKAFQARKAYLSA